MTIASKLLFYRRTCAAGLSSEREQDPALDAHQSHRLPRPRRRLGGAADHDDPRNHRGPASQRHHSSHRLVGQPEHESSPLERRGSCGFGAGTRYKGSYIGSRIGWSKVFGDNLDDRLPTSVLQARARLVERLKSVHLTESRQNDFALGVAPDEYKYAEGPSMVDTGNWKVGTSTESLESMAPFGMSSPQMDHSSLFHVVNEKSSALSGLDIHGLEEETFEGSAGSPESSRECSICLDQFSDGEVLIRLQCNHRFHDSCLEPWIQAHGVCPYCRSSVVNRSCS